MVQSDIMRREIRHQYSDKPWMVLERYQLIRNNIPESMIASINPVARRTILRSLLLFQITGTVITGVRNILIHNMGSIMSYKAVF